MNHKIIITIARQYGSGGRAIGQKLADHLGIPFYDKELIQLAAKDSGIDKGLFENADETHTSTFWNTMSINTNVFGNRITAFNDIPMNDKLFLIQSNIIKKVANEGSCVIVGRCADYILREEQNTVHVFIHSNAEDKLHRIINNYNIPESNAKDIMIKTDKKRSTYYNYYSDGKWGRAENYDLSINSGAVGIDGAIKIIKEFAVIKLGI